MTDETAGATKTKPTNAEKRAKKSVAKKEAKAKKAPKVREGKEGVLYNIGFMIARKEGATKNEIVEHLAATFPDRDANGMKTTVGIQLTRIPAKYNLELKKNKDEVRGLVYKMPAALPKLMLKGTAPEAEA